ncbi:MAG: hypothetical protein OXU81_10355 [Gammaproteobacteria bacterium]|nr:hypothetical protein [Gammaproteobacteria bacterium]
MEDQKRLAAVFDQPPVDRDGAIQLLTGTQDAEEVVLDLVDLRDIDNQVSAGAVPNAGALANPSVPTTRTSRW